MYYRLIYQLQNSEESHKVGLQNREEALAYIKQLYRGVVSLGGIIQQGGIDSFQKFQIIETNYLQETSNGEYIVSMDNDGHPDFESTGSIFQPIYNDITTILFDECRVTSGDKRVYLDEDILYIYGEKILLKKGVKWGEALDLIFSFSQGNNNVKVFSFITLKKILEEKDYMELSEDDIYFEGLRGILKYKLQGFKSDYNADILKLSQNKIQILL